MNPSYVQRSSASERGEIGGRFAGYWYQTNNKFRFSSSQAVQYLKEKFQEEMENYTYDYKNYNYLQKL